MRFYQLQPRSASHLTPLFYRSLVAAFCTFAILTILAQKASATTIPTAPVIGVVAGNATATVSWSAVTGATTYNVYYALTGSTLALLRPTSGLSYAVTRLANGKSYSFAVSATNAAGTSPMSASVSVIPSTAGSAVTITSGPTAAVTTSSATITWTTSDAAGSVLNYGLTTALGTTITSTTLTTTHSVTVIRPNTGATYYYSASSTDAARTTATAQGTFVMPPSAPSSLVAIATPATVALTWRACTGTTTYSIYQAIGTGEYTLATTSSTPLTTITGLTNGVVYMYYVTASNAGGTTVASPAVYAEPGATGIPDLGPGASLHGKLVFPPDNPWNTPINTMPVDPNSATLINTIGSTAPLHPDFGTDPDYGIPYVVVAGTQPLVPVTFYYNTQSDPGPYPIPPTAPIEGGASSNGDRHVLVIDRDHWKLYETWSSYPVNNGTSWTAGSGATWDLDSDALRPPDWTSADAAGLPIFPGLVRYDEVQAGFIGHAIRFTAPDVMAGYIYPARHYSGSLTGSQYPPFGCRVRLKASFDISRFPADDQVILQAMKTYGLILADIGSSWYFQGASDSRWSDDDLDELKTLTGSDFEVVQMGRITTN